MAIAGAALVALLERASTGPRPKSAAIAFEVSAPPTAGEPLAARPSPLRFAWPPEGRALVHAEHAEDGQRSSETFELQWRTLPAGALFLEAFPLSDGEQSGRALPAGSRTIGSKVIPVQAVVSLDGRSAHAPNEDSRRALRAWIREKICKRNGSWPSWPAPFSADFRAALALADQKLASDPLVDLWEDWVARWVGVALAPGAEQPVVVEHCNARARIRCLGLDREFVRLEFRLERPPGSGSEPQEAATESRAAGEIRSELERVVEAELHRDGLRPHRIRHRSRMAWKRSATDVRRVFESESVFSFDWTPPPVELPREALSDRELPPALAAWAGWLWPDLSLEERCADIDWWRSFWSELPRLRRAKILAGSTPPGPESESLEREEWLELRPHLRRLWLGEEAAVKPRPSLRTWLESGPSEACVDVLFVGDGYTAADLGESGSYWGDVGRVADQLLREIPFAWYRDWFNVRAVFLESKDPGCDLDPGVDEVDTTLDICFDDERRLALRNQEALRAAVREAGGADIVLVMVNSSGSRGTADGDVALFTSRDVSAHRMALHELGHSFAGLADEYVEGPLQERYPLPPSYSEIQEPNITLAGRFNAADAELLRRTLKWGHFLRLPGAERFAWLHEGGYYRSRGVFRPWSACRMRDDSDPFCPVCCEELARRIHETCDLPWDDAAYHRAHPLELWEESG